MKRSRKKVLIVQLGACDAPGTESGRATDLAEVFRSTAVLNLFRGDRVSWLTAPEAAPLLAQNPLLRRLLVSTPGTLEALTEQRFDLLLNLDPHPEVVEFARSVPAARRAGCDEGAALAARARGLDGIFELAGARWDGEEYVLGFRPESPIAYDLGFVIQDGPDGSIRDWPREDWTRLEALLARRWTISVHRRLEDLTGFMEWIHSCRVLVGPDGLGLSLALAMKRQVVVLPGSGTFREVQLWGRGIAPGPGREMTPEAIARAIRALLAEPLVA